MNDNGSERLARIEEAITTMAIAMKEQAAAIKYQAEVTARGMETLVSMHRVLDTRLTVLETQVGEVIVELRSHARRMDDLIVEFRGHTHEAA
jgi:hypothetical protein